MPHQCLTEISLSLKWNFCLSRFEDVCFLKKQQVPGSVTLNMRPVSPGAYVWKPVNGPRQSVITLETWAALEIHNSVPSVHLSSPPGPAPLGSFIFVLMAALDNGPAEKSQKVKSLTPVAISFLPEEYVQYPCSSSLSQATGNNNVEKVRMLFFFTFHSFH